MIWVGVFQGFWLFRIVENLLLSDICARAPLEVRSLVDLPFAPDLLRRFDEAKDVYSVEIACEYGLFLLTSTAIMVACTLAGIYAVYKVFMKTPSLEEFHKPLPNWPTQPVKRQFAFMFIFSLVFYFFLFCLATTKIKPVSDAGASRYTRPTVAYPDHIGFGTMTDSFLIGALGVIVLGVFLYFLCLFFKEA